MKILVLNWRCLQHPQAGGGEVNIFEQSRHWAHSGHEVTALCADPGRTRAPLQTEVSDGVQILRMGGQFSVYARAALHMLRRGHHYDAILDVSNGIPFFSPLFTRTPSVLFVHHVHDKQWSTEFSAPVAAFGRFLECVVVPALYRRRQVIAVSSTTRADLLRLGYRDQAISIVESGVSLTQIREPLAPLPGQRILYLGRLKRYKRIDKIIRAVAALKADLPKLHLDIAGDGDARPELEALVTQLGVERHVTFHGYIDELTKVQLLSSATVFVNASSHEGWGLSVIEANACGCPAVAYNVPGLRAAIKHDQTGILAETDTAFVEGIRTLLLQPDLRQRYARAAKIWADGFDWAKTAQQTEALLEDVRKQHTKRAWGLGGRHDTVA